MTRKIKVFGGNIMTRLGQKRIFLAAHSMKHASDITGISYSYMRGY